MIEKKADIISPLSDRWQMQAHHVQSEQEIFPKSPFPDHQAQIPMSCGNHADIDLESLGTPQGEDDHVVQEGKEFYLKRKRQISDLGQIQGAIVSQAKSSGLVFKRSGKRPFLMTEKLGFKQGFRQCPAIHLDKRVFSPL